MTEPAESNRELTSWKEIATYLGVSVRTAQLWERQRGMPVRRLPGGRGRVIAGTEALDAWRMLTPPEEASERPLEDEPAPAGVSRRNWILPAAAVLVAAAVPGYLGLRRPSRPASCRVRERSLIVLDEGGRELWTHVSDWPLHSIPANHPYEKERVWFGDIDDDGQTEVLWARHPSNYPPKAPSLLCFSETGRVKWEFVPSRTVATRRETFPPPYNIRAIAAGKLGARGKTIAIAISHEMYYPAAVVLLGPDGQPRGEYWHSGHLASLLIGDLDGDGKAEICATGTNNAESEATLVLLDPDNFGGASVEADPDYQLLGFSPAKEKRRVLFPRSCINRAKHVRNMAWGVSLRRGEVVVEVGESIGYPWASVYYHFRGGLELRNVRIGDDYKVGHKRLEQRGLLDHPFSQDEEAPLSALRFLKS